ncbi:putative bifunctional diguanylate cyclase/phosphodiesterase [Dapis sp. BLCC M126]|uniref:putative bifunctional diguanylate cyclase/phosphodiesterase n=1 Tax=Dapis sp. BLCC M126 TaxID=3400189 RepID=UPI003CF33E1F
MSNQLYPSSITLNVLLIEDNPGDVFLILEMLRLANTTKFIVTQVERLEEGLTQLQKHKFEVILLDLNLPDSRGIETVISINQQAPHTPIIVLTVINSKELGIEAVREKAQDFLIKEQVSTAFLVRSIYYAIERKHSETEILSQKQQLEQRIAIQIQELNQLQQELNHLIHQRQNIEEELLYNASHDSLTNLQNRAWFIEQLSHVLEIAKRDATYFFSILLIDINRFQVLNASLGYPTGDQILIQFANLLKTIIRTEDSVARCGGDEFAILVENSKSCEEGIRLAQRIQETLQSPFHFDQQEVIISVSIGIVCDCNVYESGENILRDAHLAMREAKESSQVDYAIFNQDIHSYTLKRLELEQDLQQSFKRQEFLLYYQPIISLTNQKFVGFETLLRWQHTQKGFISPGQFIPIAEETGLIVEIDDWVFTNACLQLKAWQENFPQARDIVLSINLSARQLNDSSLTNKIQQILTKTQVSGKNIKLEITETTLMENAVKAVEILSELQQLNIKLSMDDFGTGYSSLSYLQRLPLNSLKIDRSFVNQMDNSQEDLEIVRAIISLAHTLEMELIAEGIETAAQLDILQSLGCEYGQGYFLSYPLKVEDATAYFE